MEKALAWLDERIRKSRLITQEETRLISVWCHLADLADGLPSEPSKSRTWSPSESLHVDVSKVEPIRTNTTEHKATDTYDYFADLDLDFADIAESLSKIGVTPTESADESTVKPLFFRAGEADGEALNTALIGIITIQEWANEDPILPLRLVLLHKLFSLPWAAYWPESFCFEQWISAFSGMLEFVYHERPVVLFSEDEIENGAFCLLIEEHMDAFTRMTRGKIRMGLPLPLLLLHPLRLSVYRESEGQDETPTAEPAIILMKGTLSRKQLQRLLSLKPNAVFIDNEREQATLISWLEAYMPIAAPLSELSLELLFRSIDSMYVTSKRRTDNHYGEAAAGMEPLLLRLSKPWRIQVATWLRNPARTWEAFDELFTRVIEHVCNDWWLQVQPDPVRTTGTMLYVARDYQECILPGLSSYYTDFIRKYPELSLCPEAEKRKLLETTEHYLNELVRYLETA
ncbi:hypothetical protein [Paenibacillus paeoniae]|uniref:Uncharacterized protein n=1 Tax=Paenibacillus paeoniae TaxID=2292705 RepID=A0A371PJX1_9BACL|nr:hypothetical protein [Paenibacillus paeoniae]REK76087.1 hypothetical protein DX130_03200 [Paenibacillus paeoniae]